MDNLLSVQEVAQQCKVSRQTIYNWCKKGYLNPDLITPTKRRYFKKEKITALMESADEQ